ncbi:MAG TPA: radical SAM protein [Candidatus Bathyarchaeota archaeon]|nr:radical SAM protein [Candidatus Bathyarchaeota archaeon]
MSAFGPVPSRRLGRSLGINNIPAKICSYSCIYCQLGRTTRKSIERRPFYDPKNLLKVIKSKVEEAKSKDERIDYLTFVPDGEPTLDENLGIEIEMLKEIRIPTAVLTNASLLWRDDVIDDLLKADLVSIKVDAVNENIWRIINRPHRSLRINKILDGIIRFSNEFKGRLITETMLIDGHIDNLEDIADFLSKIRPYKAYISIPTRPPAENWVKPVSEEIINRAFNIFSRSLGEDAVEYLIGYEGSSFALTGDLEEDLLSIMSVHPIREDGVSEVLSKANADWGIIDKMLNERKIVKLEYGEHIYYMRKIPSRPQS